MSSTATNHSPNTDTGDENDAYPTGPYPWYIVGILLLISILSYIDRYAITILILPMRADVGLSETEMGLLLGPAFTVFYALAGLPMGKIADHRSRRNLLLAGVLIWSAGTASVGFARGFEALFITRAIVGAGEACFIPAAFSLLADYFPPGRRGKAIGTVTLGMAAGSGLALMAGAAVLEVMEAFAHRNLPIIGARTGWELVFIAFGFVGICMALAILTIREPIRHDVHPEQGVRTSSVSSSTFIAFLKVYGGSIALIMVPYFLVGYMNHIFAAWAPTLFVRHLGLSLSEAAQLKGWVVLVVGSMSAILGGVVGDYLARKQLGGRFALVLILGPFMMPGFALVCLGTEIWMVVLGMTIIMSSGGLLLPTAYTTIQEIAPGNLRGRTLALYTLLHQMVGGFAPPVTAIVTERVVGGPSLLHYSMLISAFPAWIAILICGFLGRSHFRRMRKMVMLLSRNSADAVS